MSTFIYAIHRDEDLFEEPLKVKLNRDEESIKNHNLTFGSAYHLEATPENHKCPAQNVMIDTLKMFMAHFTRCDINITSDVTCTHTSSERVACTDEPLVVDKFVYKD